MKGFSYENWGKNRDFSTRAYPQTPSCNNQKSHFLLALRSFTQRRVIFRLIFITLENPIFKAYNPNKKLTIIIQSSLKLIIFQPFSLIAPKNIVRIMRPPNIPQKIQLLRIVFSVVSWLHLGHFVAFAFRGFCLFFYFSYEIGFCVGVVV